MKNWLIVYPPSADPTAPPLTLARIKAAADSYISDKVHLQCVDENQRFVKYVIDLVLSGTLHNWVKDAMEKQLPKEFMAHLKKMSKSIANLPEELLKAMAVLKIKALFLDVTKYSFAYGVLKRAFETFSLPYYPAMIGYATSRLAIDIRSSEHIKEALSEVSLNPYLNYLQNRIDALKNAHVLGISVVYSSQLLAALTLARLAKLKNSEIIVMLGGPCVSSLRHELKEGFGEFVDMVVPGDGEAFFQYLSRSRTNIGDKNNLIAAAQAYLQGPSDTWFVNPGRPLDYSWAQIEDYLLPETVLCMDITRGCYYRKCSFCAYGFREGRYRRMDSSQVVSVIRRLKPEFDCTRFFFSVDVMDLGFLKRLSESLIKAELGITYCFDARLEKGFADGRLAEKLYRSGCRAISFGMESASQHTLNAMEKGTESQYFAPILSTLNANGIHTQVHLIHGFPGESAIELSKTLQFLQEHQQIITTAGVSHFALLKGCPMEKQLDKYGISQATSLYDLSLDYEYKAVIDSQYPDYEWFAGKVLEMFPVVGRLTGSTTDYLIYASQYLPDEMKRLLGEKHG